MSLEVQDSEPLTLGDFKILMAQHEKVEKAQFAEFMSAFPGDDPVSHCNYHQSKIDAAKSEREFWEAAKLKIFEQGVSGIFGGLKVVLILALTGLAFKLGLTIPFLGK